MVDDLGWPLREANLAPSDVLIFDPGGQPASSGTRASRERARTIGRASSRCSRRVGRIEVHDPARLEDATYAAVGGAYRRRRRSRPDSISAPKPLLAVAIVLAIAVTVGAVLVLPPCTRLKMPPPTSIVVSVLVTSSTWRPTSLIARS